MTKSILQLQKLKADNKKFSVLTAYDATLAKTAADANIDAVLVGDSLGMVVQGKESTLPVSIDEMAYHCEAVVNGIKRSANTPVIIGDMPFMSYANTDAALANAALLMQTGINMVKLEGGAWLTETVSQLVQNGVPVCAHLGLTPQSVNKFGGYKVQGKTSAQQDRLINDAKSLQAAGASFLVLECIPAALASRVTEATTMSTIGIGAGADTDAQVLVCYDVLGQAEHLARFVKNFLTKDNITGENAIRDAFTAYDLAVKSGQYPTKEHQYS